MKIWIVGGLLAVSVVALAKGKVPEPPQPGPVAAPVVVAKIAKIVCEATASYDADTPTAKTPATGVKIFTRDKAHDTAQTKGFVLDEYDHDDKGVMTVFGGQRYNFDAALAAKKLTFAFLAEYKAHGELTVGDGGSAVGFLNQKDHVTELTCFLQK